MNLNTPLVVLSGENVFDCTSSSLEVRNLQGTVKYTILLSKSLPAALVANGIYLVIFCENLSIFMSDRSRRSPMLQF